MDAPHCTQDICCTVADGSSIVAEDAMVWQPVGEAHATNHTSIIHIQMYTQTERKGWQGRNLAIAHPHNTHSHNMQPQTVQPHSYWHLYKTARETPVLGFVEAPARGGIYFSVCVGEGGILLQSKMPKGGNLLQRPFTRGQSHGAFGCKNGLCSYIQPKQLVYHIENNHGTHCPLYYFRFIFLQASALPCSYGNT